MIKKLIFWFIVFFWWVLHVYAINLSDNTSFDISKQVNYVLTWTTTNPLEEKTFTWKYKFWVYLPWVCNYIYPATYLHFFTKSYLDTFSNYSSVIGFDNSWNGWWWSSCNSRVNRSGYYTSWIPKDFFYYDLPYWDSNTVFSYNSDWNLTIQKTYSVNTYSSLSFQNTYFLYNNIYVSFWGNTLSYYKINYDNLTTSLLDTRPYPSWFMTPSHIPFPYIDWFWDMKGWLYSCNNNNSICFLSSNWNYFREVVINSAWKLVWPLKFNWNNTKYIFSSNLWNNVIVYNTSLNESSWFINFIEFDSIRYWDWSQAIYFSWITLDSVWNYDINLNRVYLKDFNDFKNSSDDKTYFYDLNCITPWYTSVSYFADDNKFYCSSEEWSYKIQASDWNYYSSTCYNDIINWNFICDDSIKSPNLELAYNNLTWENWWNTSNTNTWSTNTSKNEPLNWLWINWCDYFDVVSSCDNWKYLIYNNGSLVCWAIWDPKTCSEQCSPYLYIDFRLCATDKLNNDSNQDNTNNDNTWIINSLVNLFWTNDSDVNNLKNSLSWSLNMGSNWFSIWTWWTSNINFIKWNWNYWEIINKNNADWTCDMFNQDWSFAYYSNWTYDLSINLNWLLDLKYVDKIPFLEELLIIPNKILSFITNPLQNIFSTLRVFWWVWEKTYCYFGTLQTIKFQKNIIIWTSFFPWWPSFIPWKLTIIDYLVLFFLWLPFLYLTYKLLLY